MDRSDRKTARLGTQDGAVVIIVVLSLFAIIGMLMLTVDVGNLLYVQRGVVNAADSAALAAALSCGMQEGVATANTQASQYVTLNQDSAALAPSFPQYSPSCTAPSGTVTVRVVSTQNLFFAPLFGFDKAPVSAQATATWGGAGAAENIAPLMVSANRLTDCQIPPQSNVVQEQQCTFWWDNSPKNAAGLANAEWGTLDLNNWNVAGNAQCNNSTPPEFSTWMFQGFSGALPINDPGPTYVCRGQGNFGNALDKDLIQARDQGLLLYFPANDASQQVDKNGNLCPPSTSTSTWTTCSPDKYDIIGFTRMKILQLYKGNEPGASVCIDRIPGATTSPTARCMITDWVGWQTNGFDPGTGANFGLVPIALTA
ncbi:MAG: hypothetical protein HY240_04085 [Actinobacteria bacterium]|nr:hypothetical protein [Actinomycetota bacterium]